MRQAVLFCCAVGIAQLIAMPAGAWAEHEHLEIGRTAIAMLGRPDNGKPTGPCRMSRLRDTEPNASYYKELMRAWTLLRDTDAALTDENYDPLLCKSMSDQGRCVDFAALPMMAGDHACTPTDLLDNVTQDWFFDLMTVVEDTAHEVRSLEREETNTELLIEKRLEIRRELDVHLQVADPDYLTRAAGNRGHFAVPRNQLTESLRSYLRRVVPEAGFRTVRQNTVALYLHYHGWALHYASRATNSNERAAVARRLAFLYEAYALHFLQDSFSTGHIVGAPEADALRFGTHDYYCKNGLNVTLWDESLSGDRCTYVAHGDAFLYEIDRERASVAMVESLKQLASAFAGKDELTAALARDEWRDAHDHPPLINSIDSCNDAASPLLEHHISPKLIRPSKRVIAWFPRPAVGPEPWLETISPDVASVPSYRSEYGAFVPFIADIRFGPYFFPGEKADTAVLAPEVYAGLGIGVSTDGVLSSYTDALMMVAPIASLGADYTGFGEEQAQGWAGNAGVGLRVRLPYAYIPGDAVVWAPLAGAGLRAGYRAAEQAFRGGFLGGASVFFIGPVRVQFDLGREVDFVWKFRSKRDRMSPGTGNPERPFNFYQWDVTLPVGSVRVVKSFDGQFGNTTALRLALRLGTRKDREPEDPGVPLDPTGFYLGGLLSINNVVRLYLN